MNLYSPITTGEILVGATQATRLVEVPSHSRTFFTEYGDKMPLMKVPRLIFRVSGYFYHTNPDRWVFDGLIVHRLEKPFLERPSLIAKFYELSTPNGGSYVCLGARFTDRVFTSFEELVEAAIDQFFTSRWEMSFDEGNLYEPNRRTYAEMAIPDDQLEVLGLHNDQ